MEQASSPLRMGIRKRLILFVLLLTLLNLCMGAVSVFQISRIAGEIRMFLQDETRQDRLMSTLEHTRQSAVIFPVMTAFIILFLSLLVIRSISIPLSRISLALKSSLKAAEDGDRTALRKSAAIVEELAILLDIRPEQPSK